MRAKVKNPNGKINLDPYAMACLLSVWKNKKSNRFDHKLIGYCTLERKTKNGGL